MNQAAPGNRPNIVLICTDQQRADSLRCAGNPHALTPHLDQLAADGCMCEQGIAANTVCMPSRASLLSGLYPASHGVWTNGVPLPRRGYLPETSSSGGGLPPGEVAMSHVPTLADELLAAGYRTVSIGKQHLTPTQSHPSFGYEESTIRWNQEPSLNDWHGPYYGFEHVELSLGHAEAAHGHFRDWLEKNHPGALQRARQAAEGPREFPEARQLYPGGLRSEETQSTWCAQTARMHIEQHARNHLDKPLLLWVGFANPHHPFTPSSDLAEEFSRRDVMMPSAGHGDWPDKPRALRRFMKPGGGWYCPPEAVKRVRQYTDAMNHLIDRCVGQIRDSLEANGMWDNTVVVFTSDHGDFLGDYGLMYKTNHSCNALSHVPLIIRDPAGRLPDRIQSPVSLIDLMPTLLDMAGREIPDRCQGESLLQISQAGRKRPVITQQFPALREETNHSIHDQRYQLVWYPATEELELYDRVEDPYEQRNLAGDPGHRETRDGLLMRLKDMVARTTVPRAGRISIW
ncbi:MAG: sulfatase-like hydrolase/transferase [Phycisphaeraceae bacterium]|nr:sulfatase-like hydrolase/transferase [Phycisphaeraceae bacterium]